MLKIHEFVWWVGGFSCDPNRGVKEVVECEDESQTMLSKFSFEGWSMSFVQQSSLHKRWGARQARYTLAVMPEQLQGDASRLSCVAVVRTC